MALENIYWIQFHSPLFFAGRNFGEKVQVDKIQGLKIAYDDELSLFNIEYNNPQLPGIRKAKMPWTSAYLWETVEDKEAANVPEVVNEHVTQDVNKIKKAQASTPQGHVFEGPGKGKTGK